MKNDPLPRLDLATEVREKLLPHCRLHQGEVWIDPNGRHRVACIDAGNLGQVNRLMRGNRSMLAIQDPPYNLIAFERRTIDEYIQWCEQWAQITLDQLADDSALYVWLGADQNDGFQPLPDFMVMMRRFEEVRPRSFITMRNQRGYGTQKNWMAVRQELLYYIKGNPGFNVQYTDIPKTLRGYYKEVDGKLTENLERSKSDNIRAGNVWIDVQQVFYRMEENVSGCYAQKPLKAIERIVKASSEPDDLVIDLFSHSGTTLLACERLGRCCCAADIDPVYCEITIRRLELFRSRGRLGWQNGHPFEDVYNDSANGDAPRRKSREPVQQVNMF